MKKYYIASSEFRDSVDLRIYKDEIVAAVKVIIPGAKVHVQKEYYTVNHITRGQAVAIGRILARTALWKYHIYAPKLFIGEEMETSHEPTISR